MLKNLHTILKSEDLSHIMEKKERGENMERLKEARVKAGITQHEIAEALNINRTTYNKYENGASKPTPETLSRIADYFHVSVDYLLGRDSAAGPAPSLSVAQNLKHYRKLAGLRTVQAAQLAGVPGKRWLDWEQGKALPTDEELAFAADALEVSVDDLRAEPEDDTVPGLLPVKKKKIPVLGEIACGKPIFADEQREVWVSVSEELVCDYALIAKGDSMLPRIRDGDLVFIREMPVVENGKIAAVLIDDEATLKRVFYDSEKQKLMLVPDNPNYEPFMYVGEELMTIRILGLAVAAQTIL